MKDGIGKGLTREDHAHLASQLFAAYSRVKQVRGLAAVIGEEELSTLDKRYIEFGTRFEGEYLRQGPDEERTIEQTLDLGWNVLTTLPRAELYRVTAEEIAKYYEPAAADGKEKSEDTDDVAGDDTLDDEEA